MLFAEVLGRLDTGAPGGRSGTWLLDPLDILVQAGGTAPLAYQLSTNGVAITGANTNSYTRSNVTINDALGYSVVGQSSGTPRGYREFLFEKRLDTSPQI